MRTKMVVICIVVLLVCAAIPAISASLTLSTTIRDFNASHPDFEDAVATDRGFVGNTIGVDRKPVYIGGAGTATTSGAANFNQWYNDVAGINKSMSYSLTLSELVSGSGIYSYSNSYFFPIDNQLFGNEGRSHNYHFTLETHNMFTYQTGQKFSFTGDDDLFVFINDKLAIDLGGVHGAQSASVNLDTLGLVSGNNYNFDLFFAERHTTESNFKIDTSIRLRPQAVPEPATLLGFGLPMLMVGLGKLRQFRK